MPDLRSSKCERARLPAHQHNPSQSAAIYKHTDMCQNSCSLRRQVVSCGALAAPLSLSLCPAHTVGESARRYFHFQSISIPIPIPVSISTQSVLFSFKSFPPGCALAYPPPLHDCHQPRGIIHSAWSPEKPRPASARLGSGPPLVRTGAFLRQRASSGGFLSTPPKLVVRLLSVPRKAGMK